MLTLNTHIYAVLVVHPKMIKILTVQSIGFTDVAAETTAPFKWGIPSGKLT
jgi:hypothetical protein